jgi:hypothetical protein
LRVNTQRAREFYRWYAATISDGVELAHMVLRDGKLLLTFGDMQALIDGLKSPDAIAIQHLNLIASQLHAGGCYPQTSDPDSVELLCDTFGFNL